MDGSVACYIAVPIVATLSLAAWLIMVYYAEAHPQRKRDITPTGTACAADQNRGGRENDQAIGYQHDHAGAAASVPAQYRQDRPAPA
jgi:hypothetical protein